MAFAIYLSQVCAASDDVVPKEPHPNELTDIFNQNINKGEASELIESWIHGVKLSGLTCFDKFIDTLRNNWHEILNSISRIIHILIPSNLGELKYVYIDQSKATSPSFS